MVNETRMYSGDRTCGPVAMQLATDKPYTEIIEAWPGEWSGTDNDKGLLFLPNDTPYDHFTCLEKLGINYRNIPLSDVLDGKAKEGKTVLLLHLVNKPENKWQAFLNFFRGLFKQHWVLLAGYTPYDSMYLLDWGYWRQENGKAVPDTRIVTRDELETMLTTSFPNCAYTVDTATTDKVSWWQKLYARVV